MAFNDKQTHELMKRAGWTASTFMAALNSTARAEAHAAYLKTNRYPDVVPQLDLETATQWFENGRGIDGPAFDVLERWVERRTGFSNSMNGMTFAAPPPEQRPLSSITPPVLEITETQAPQDAIAFKDVTSDHPRQKCWARSVRWSRSSGVRDRGEQMVHTTTVQPALQIDTVERFQFDKLLSIDLIRQHTKTDDIPSVSDEQLALYRDAAVESAEQYTGLMLSGVKSITEPIDFKITTRVLMCGL